MPIRKFLDRLRVENPPYNSENEDGPTQILHLIILGLVIATIIAPLVSVKSTLFILSLTLIFAILAFSAIIPIGYLDQLILCQGAFFGIGSYTFVKTLDLGTPSWISLILATVFTGLVAYIIGKPSIRSEGLYLGILTLAFNEIFISIIFLMPEVLGSDRGLPVQDLNFPQFMIQYVDINILYYYLILLTWGIITYSSYKVLRSEIGWQLRAVQEDFVMAETLGIDTTRIRLASFVVTGLICGLAGGLYAPMAGYISPGLYDLQAVIMIILTGVLGGITYPLGSILGASVVIIVPEMMRFLLEIRFILFGALLIVLLIYLPNGIADWIHRFTEDL